MPEGRKLAGWAKMVGPSSKVYKGIREIGMNEEDVEDWVP